MLGCAVTEGVTDVSIKGVVTVIGVDPSFEEKVI